jgi:hypothetical protein
MNISTGYNTSVVAIARDTSNERTIEGLLTIYDLESGCKTRKFAVRYDFGGRRLALSRDHQSCFVGCYNVHGLAAYSALDGSELWRRKDLKAVQGVDAFPFDDAVFCGREGAGHVLCVKTGRTIEKPRGVKRLYPSPLSKHVLASARTLDLHSPFGTRIGKIERTTFAELDCCFSESEVLVTESGGAVRCFDLASLSLLWTHTPTAGSHFLRLCFSQAVGCFVGVRWHYKDSTDPVKRIVHFDPRTGTVLRDIPLGTPAGHQFCLAGSTIFTSDFRLLSVETGKLIREFRHRKDDDHAALKV